MTCLPGYIAQPQSEIAVRCRQEGQGDTFRAERRRQRVECSLCGVALAHGSMKHHRLRMHGLVTVTDDVVPPPPPEILLRELSCNLTIPDLSGGELPREAM